MLRPFHVQSGLSAFMALVVCLASMGIATADDGPKYTSDGKQLLLPTGFQRWVFVGANLGLGYTEEVAQDTPRELARNKPSDVATNATPNPGDFHNVYLATDSYEKYTASGKFPEGTVLVMDVYASKQKEPQNIVDRGFYEADRKVIEVAVKNATRPDRTPESKGDWAYYIFKQEANGNLEKSASAFPDRSCFDCHKKHAGDDNVWVQFYPVIRK